MVSPGLPRVLSAPRSRLQVLPLVVLRLSLSPGTLVMALETLTPVQRLPQLTPTTRKERSPFTVTRLILPPRLLKPLRRLSRSRPCHSPYHSQQPQLQALSEPPSASQRPRPAANLLTRSAGVS